MDEAGAREALLHLLHQDPTQYGQSQARWSLAGLIKATQDWLRLTTQAGMSQLLKRLKIVWKNARYHEHSPDPNYVDKLRTVKQQILAAPKQGQVVLFEDEFTLYRHPELGRAYEQQGKAQPLAELGYLGNYTYRIAAALNVWTGQVVYHAAWMLDITRMIRFYRKLTQTFPDQEILLIEDNWSIHYHPDLIAALQPQSFPYGTHAPPNWSRNPKRKVDHLNLPIRLVFLPTYASWTNPIEKLWRWLKQDVLRLHRYADDWPALKQRVWDFLDQFKDPSPDLLRYVGLQDPTQLYRALFPAGSF